MHGAIDLLRVMHSERPNLRAEDVSAIDIAVIGAGQALVSFPVERKLVIETSVDAQFNMPFGAIAALSRGGPSLADFDAAPEVARQLASWLPKVHTYTSEAVEAAYPASWHAEVSVALTSGEILHRSTAAFRGSPDLPPSWVEMVGKATELIGNPATVRLREAVDRISLRLPWQGQLDEVRAAG
jgi:2-methylcitrate dehydratase PrpD